MWPPEDGVWDEIEPQVYDVLLDAELMRLAFDPDALPEHPQAQLATFGSPLFDRLLVDAADRWNSAVCYRVGLHPVPRKLEALLERAFTLAPGMALQLRRTRAMHFPQAVFWLTATFTTAIRRRTRCCRSASICGNFRQCDILNP